MLHVDLDQFIAAVEVLRRPELAGLPVVVGGRGDPTERGVVSTASYEAREFGVGSGMPLRLAAAQVPGRGVPAGRRTGLRRRVGEVMATLRSLELGRRARWWSRCSAGTRRSWRGRATGHGGPRRPARTSPSAIQAEVLAATRLHCSVGIGDNKLRAKIATDFGKPRGDLAADRRELVRGDGRPARPRRCGGSASKTAKKLAALGIDTVDQLAASDARVLAAELGPTMGPWYHRLGRGVDTSPVDATPWVPRAHGREETFQRTSRTGPTSSEEVRALTRPGGRGHRPRGPAGGAGRAQGPLPAVHHGQPQPHPARADATTPTVLADAAVSLLDRVEQRPAGAAARRPAGDGAEPPGGY